MISNPLFIIGLALLLLTMVWAKWNAWMVTKAAPPAGEIIDVAGAKMHLIRRGKNSEEGLRPIVLIHGSTTNALDMDIGLAESLSAERVVIMPDRLGHGFSSRPEQGWRLDLQARTIKEALDVMGIVKPIILGQSFGGAVALRYALDFPNDVAGLVLVAPVTHRWRGGVAWYNKVGINPLYGSLFRHSFFSLYGRFGSLSGVRQALHGSVYQDVYHSRTRAALTFRPDEFRYNCEDITRLYEQLVAIDTRYHEIDMPTEIVAGTHDMSVITSMHSRSLEQQISGASLRVIDHAGHALHHSHPAETLAAIKRVDERLASKARSPLQGALHVLSSVLPGA